MSINGWPLPCVYRQRCHVYPVEVISNIEKLLILIIAQMKQFNHGKSSKRGILR